MKSSNSEVGLLEARALTYKIISELFINPPNAEIIKLTSEEKLFESLPLELKTKEFQQGLFQLRRWSNRINEESLYNVLTQLNADYQRLFVGPSHLLAPPWESVYLTDEGLTFDRITLDVREFYRSHDLEFILINKKPDDHFGVELEFMANLINRQIQHLENKQFEEASFLMQEQETFLRLHLTKWTPHFADSILKGAQTDYYQGLALVANDFIKWDYEFLSNEEVHKFTWLTEESKEEWEVEKW